MSVDDRTIDSAASDSDGAAFGRPHGATSGAGSGDATALPPSSGGPLDATVLPPNGGAFDTPPQASGGAVGRSGAGPARIDPMIGKTVGRYAILDKLGEGGFGAVYLAEQTEPVRRKVALKLMRAGADRADLVARFEAERQAMAVMNHPGVAKVWDAGALPDGAPFFAMEYVPGKPLDEFADAERLDLRARTRLFLQVCDAIQHAHTKGIVHRDLKPGNILVMRDVDTLHAKVIDFGIAKAVNTTLHTRAFETQFGHFVGTPAYMSPEQADGKADIDTRSDVYTLGVILYELLTGWLPLDAKTLQGVGVSELSRVVREYRPPSPPQRIKQIEADDSGRAQAIAMARATDVPSLGKALRGDVERIIAKAMEKDREVRYQGASALGDDLRSWLAGDPVSAGPPGTAYRVRKLIAKHRVAVAASLFLVLLVAASSVAMAVLWRLAVTQEARAKQTLSTFLVALRSANSQGSNAEVALTIKDLLIRVERAVNDQLQDDPQVAAELYDTVGQLYLAFSDYEPARKNLVEALALRDALASDTGDEANALDAVRTRLNIARAQYFLKDYPASEASFGAAVEGLDRLASTEVRERAEARAMLAAAQVQLKKLDDADRNAATALDMLKAEFGEESDAYGTALFARSMQLQILQRFDDATKGFATVVRIFTKVAGPDDWRVGRALRQLSVIQISRGERAAALPNLKRSVQLMEQRFGETDPLVTMAMYDLAESMLLLNTDLTEAREIARRSLTGRRTNGKNPTNTAASLALMSRIDEAKGDLPAAVKWQREAVDLLRAITPQGSPGTTLAVARLGRLLLQANELGEAEQLLLEATQAALREGDGSAAALKQATEDLATIRAALEAAKPQ